MKLKILTWVCVMLGTARVESSIFKKLGHTLTLTPDISSFPEPIKSILWRHDNKKIAELDRDFYSEVDYYGDFRNRTTLDTQTGHLVINGLRIKDTGVYSLDLNSKPQQTTFDIAVIKEVPEPQITVKCETPRTSCTLTCEGDTTGAEPVTYSWRGGEKELGATDKTLTVTEADQQVEMFTCQMKNPVSEKSSTGHKNPFSTSGLPAKVRTGISVFIIFLCAIVVVVVVHRYKSGVWFYQKESMPWTAAFWTIEPEAGAGGNNPLDNDTTAKEGLLTGEPGGANGTNLPAEGDNLNTARVGTEENTPV